MKKLLTILSLITLAPLLLGASSSINFSSVGNLGGYQGTDWTDAGASTVTAVSGGAVKGTIVTDSVKWRRVGDSMELRWDYEQSATGTSGTGRYILTIPGGYTIDTTKQGVSTTDKFAVGYGYFSNNSDSLSGTTVPGTVFAYDSTHLAFAALNTTSTQTQIGASLFGFANSANIKYTVFARIPISGWSGASPNGVTLTSEVTVDSGNGNGSTATKIRRFSNIRKNVGTDITYADSATAGATFTINTSGIYSVNYHDNYSSGVAALAITVNDSATTDWSPPTYAQGVRAISAAPSGYWGQVSWTGHLSAGDIVRAHNNGNVDNSGVGCMFTITRIQ